MVDARNTESGWICEVVLWSVRTEKLKSQCEDVGQGLFCERVGDTKRPWWSRATTHDNSILCTALNTALMAKSVGLQPWTWFTPLSEGKASLTLSCPLDGISSCSWEGGQTSWSATHLMEMKIFASNQRILYYSMLKSINGLKEMTI